MEEIAYHAVIHLLMGALGFIPFPNKGRQLVPVRGSTLEILKTQCRSMLQPTIFGSFTSAITTLGNMGFRTNIFSLGAPLPPKRSWHG